MDALLPCLVNCYSLWFNFLNVFSLYLLYFFVLTLLSEVINYFEKQDLKKCVQKAVDRSYSSPSLRLEPEMRALETRSTLIVSLICYLLGQLYSHTRGGMDLV